MLNRKQIDNFLKMRCSQDSLVNIKNIIILSMIKFYDDNNIIKFIDEIDIIDSDMFNYEFNNKHIIYVPSKISLFDKIEGLLLRINYLYQYNNMEYNGLRNSINVLQVEDIMKYLFKILLLHNISGMEELLSINYKNYKCYSMQIETNLVRPFYRYIKKIDKNIIKDSNLMIKYIHEINEDNLNKINELFNDSHKYLILNEKEYEISENFRLIKDMFKSIVKIMEDK